MKTTAKRILVLVGPTASGKTDVSLLLAQRLNGEILSADSRQIYKHLAIGTAKPSPEEMTRVKHYFVDELLPNENFNAGEFGERGRVIIQEIFQRSCLPIVVGGSGLYVRSLIDGFFEGPGADQEFRDILERRVAAGGVSELIEELRLVDPVSAEKADPTKPRRVIRALEVFHRTGKPISIHHAESKVNTDFEPVLFGLEWERSELYGRINRRCEKMIENGMLQELESVLEMGFDASSNALNTVGYAEAMDYLNGVMSNDEMIRLFKQNSRRYAKRQLTWFRKDDRIRWIRMDEERSLTDVADEIEKAFLIQ